MTTRTYTATDQVDAVTDPLGRVTTATYDPAGRQLSQTDPDGHTTIWTYDAAGQEATTSVDGKLLASISRDRLRRRVVISDSLGGEGLSVEHELGFDRCGRLTSRTRGPRGLSWAYDADGNRTAFTDAHGTTTTYRWDAAGRVTAVSNPALGEATFTHDRSGRILSATAGELVQEWVYRYGALAEHSRADRSDPGTADVTLIGRDGDGRITGLARAGAVTRYGYDGAGQMVSAATTRNGEQDTSVPAVVSEWVYDAGGRLVRESAPGGPRTYEYDTAGQLVSVTEPDGSRTEYVHDGLGRRTRLIGADGSWTEYAWGPTGYLNTTTDRTPDGIATYRHELRVDALGELACVDGAELWWDTANPFPTLAGIGDGQVLSLPGGVTGFGDAWMAPGWRSARPTDQTDPWAVIGAPTIPNTAPGGTPGAGSAGLAGLLPAGITLTGNGGLDIAGLEWLGARAYDPASRGFLSTDPLSPVLGAGWDGNPYAYAGNNPLNTTDPTGLRPLTDEDLKAYDGSSRGAFAAAGDWLGDNWEIVVAGIAIAAGIALMCTGVGGPAGLALMMGAGALVSGGVSVATQKVGNGSVNWSQVGVDTAVGALAGGLGAGTGALIAARSGAGLAARAGTAAAAGAVEGGVSGGATYAASPGPHTPGGFIQATGTGAAIGGVTGGVTGYKPKWLGKKDIKTFKYGIYRSGYLHEETVLSRAGDSGFRKDFGRFWSADAPTHVLQARHDKAILPEWYDKTGAITSYSPLSMGYSANFVPGTATYSGTVRSQIGLDGTLYAGGTQQVLVPNSYNHGTIIDQWKLK